MAVDYGALQPVNALGSLMGGMQAGRQMRQDRGRQNALALYASGDAEGAAKGLIEAGDLETGVALKRQAAAEAQAARRKAIGTRAAGGDIAGARAEAVSEGDFDFDSHLAKMSEEQKAAARDRAEWLASYALDAKKVPLEARKAKGEADAPLLLERGGLLPQQIANFDWTDQSLDSVIGSVMDLKTKLERQDKAQARDDTLSKPDWKERKRADGSTEWFDANPNNGGERGETSEAGETAPDAEPAGPTRAPQGGIYGQIGEIAAKGGAQPNEITYLQRLAQVESDGDPAAKNGRSTGVFQFHPDTFASVGGGNINDVGDQTNAAMALARRDRQNLAQIGIEPTDANLYIMHQQGAGGGRALLTAPPETGAVAVLTPIYGNAATAKKAIVGNGGREDMTAGEFVDYWRQRWSGGPRPAAPTGEKAPASARTIQGDGPQPKGRMATQEDKTRLGLTGAGQYWIDPDGKPTPVSGEKPDKPLTEYQGKSVEYLNAALGGNERMNKLASEGLFKPQTVTDSLFTKDKDGGVRLVLRTDKDRQFMQAAKEWLAPILRKDTGAAVTDTELAYYMDIYIPKFEDSPKVMWQKAQARDQKMRSLYGANRAAYNQTFGDPGKWKVLTDPKGRGAKAVAKPSPGKAKPSLDEIFG